MDEIDPEIFSSESAGSFKAKLHSEAPRTLVNSIPMDGTDFIAPFVPCSVQVARAAVEYAEVSFQDVLGDLGCGDGRILVEAAKLPSPPAKAIGVELDPHLAAHLRTSIIPKLPKNYLRVIEANMFTLDLHALEISCLVLYLLPKGLNMLKPQLKEWLSRGESKSIDTVDGISNIRRRIVTITYSIPGWRCERAMQFNPQYWLFYYDFNDVC